MEPTSSKPAGSYRCSPKGPGAGCCASPSTNSPCVPNIHILSSARLGLGLGRGLGPDLGLRGVGRRAVGPLPQPLLLDRRGPAHLNRVAQVRRQPIVHQAVGELVHQHVTPRVARVGVGGEQVLLAARGPQPAWSGSGVRGAQLAIAARAFVRGELRLAQAVVVTRPPRPRLSLVARCRPLGVAGVVAALPLEVPVLGQVAHLLAPADNVDAGGASPHPLQ
eukprot:scaffold15921_cov58-Phaeocystis_antarctica.AAC.2